VIPLLMVLYVVSYIDRINVGFAALTMNHDIGLNEYTYGWGAGIFSSVTVSLKFQAT
jgi:ACS family tartrate transporter-like MFS transporter